MWDYSKTPRKKLIMTLSAIFEPPHDKTNKVACAPSEDSDQTGHAPSVIRDFAVRLKKAGILSYPLSAQRRLWSDWADSQADLSLRWAHSHFVGFVMRRLISERLLGNQESQTIIIAYLLCLSITNEPPHDKTSKVAVRPAKTQISLGIRPVWSESSLCAQCVANDPRFLHADSEDSDQTGRMPRLIWVFAGRTFILLVFVGWNNFTGIVFREATVALPVRLRLFS